LIVSITRYPKNQIEQIQYPAKKPRKANPISKKFQIIIQYQSTSIFPDPTKKTNVKALIQFPKKNQ